eukprot:CAMPEP_0173360506 /NCGR_PEP_ID=MMETSP1144-20121109/20641_1 /TAXON_ID=483371 /ORGANISM="non described non described, Strain CCMP2298" /LENGTH=72 /DNA_ID=CAMNT_0014309899 /DNA_START=20 /DNA_END=235 /DNA_ORIENTATION=-
MSSDAGVDGASAGNGADKVVIKAEAAAGTGSKPKFVPKMPVKKETPAGEAAGNSSSSSSGAVGASSGDGNRG